MPKTLELRLYLDSNALIEAVEGRSSVSSALAELLSKPRLWPPRFVTSELALAELLVKPFELGRRDLLDAYEQILVSDETLEVTPIDRYVLRGAAVLRSHHRSLKIADAIHVATCLRTGCTHLVTNDRRIVAPSQVVLVRLTLADIASLSTALDLV